MVSIIKAFYIKVNQFLFKFNFFYKGCSQMETKAPLIPMEDFMRNPEKSSFQISPNGNYVAFMKPWKTRMNVFVKDMKTNKEERLTSSEKEVFMALLG